MFLPGDHQLVQPTRQTSHWTEGKIQSDGWNPIQSIIASSTTFAQEVLTSSDPEGGHNSNDWGKDIDADGWTPIEPHSSWNKPEKLDMPLP